MYVSCVLSLRAIIATINFITRTSVLLCLPLECSDLLGLGMIEQIKSLLTHFHFHKAYMFSGA